MSQPIGTPRVRLPGTIRAGEVIEVRTLITHNMETGQRRDAEGRVIPRDILARFVARFEGEVVFEAELHPAIAANPYIAFPFRAERAGRFEFVWTNDTGQERRLTTELRLTA
jgi:sulfur-oxidizing protein SoxZ